MICCNARDTFETRNDMRSGHECKYDLRMMFTCDNFGNQHKSRALGFLDA